MIVSFCELHYSQLFSKRNQIENIDLLFALIWKKNEMTQNGQNNKTYAIFTDLEYCKKQNNLFKQHNTNVSSCISYTSDYLNMKLY